MNNLMESSTITEKQTLCVCVCVCVCWGEWHVW